jgi:hypothetical protein
VQQEELANGGVHIENGATHTDKSANFNVSPNSRALRGIRSFLGILAHEFGETLEFALFSVRVAPFSMQIPPFSSSHFLHTSPTLRPPFILNFTFFLLFKNAVRLRYCTPRFFCGSTALFSQC